MCITVSQNAAIEWYPINWCIVVDLLGIPDDETYDYGAGLRRMAVDLGYETIRFTRIMNLLGLTDNEDVSKEEYLETVARTRDQMVAQYLNPEFDAREAILNDTDINLTYCGYMLFLAKDLRSVSY